MILSFPDPSVLRLVLTTGILSPAVVQSGVVAGYDDRQHLWVSCSGSLARNVQRELRNLSVVISQEMGTAATQAYDSWLELVSLQADSRPLENMERVPVLFDLHDGADLGPIVHEILRLGNDRQSFRWLSNDEGAARAVLRVIGPPYYTLLRALEPQGKATAPVAYCERAPSIWVELGHTYPLLEFIKPPRGKLLLLRAGHRWMYLEDGPFRDIYEAIEFSLHDRPIAWQDGTPAAAIKIALTLRPGGETGGALMWVLRDDAETELNRFVQDAPEQLLSSLAFAVGERAGRKTMVLRTLHARSAPPELVLNATPYKPHLRLPNLFVPAGMVLHPHLRRDAVRNLLADDIERVVWLVPGENGSFTPESLAENAFRPLSDWVAYVLDQAEEPLQEWMQSMKFEFESFICDESGDSEPKKPNNPKDKGPKKSIQKRPKNQGEAAIGQPAETPNRANTTGEAALNEDKTAIGEAAEPADRVKRVESSGPEIYNAAELESAEPGALQLRLQAVESRFLSVEGPLDAPERQKLWPELASLNGALKATDDAGLCWLAAFWAQDQIPEKWAQDWLYVEAAAVRSRPELNLPGNRTWVGSPADGAAPNLDALHSLDVPMAADLRALAAYIVWSARQHSVPTELVGNLPAVRRFLEQHEHLLPVRAVWLAWTHLVQLSQGDVLAIARTRDRLLERLYQDGLRAERDLPSFLRSSGQRQHTPQRGLGPWLTDLCDWAHIWAEENGRSTDKQQGELSAPMQGYIDLLFALGHARLGERDASRQLLQRGTSKLRDEEPVHTQLSKAFEYRVRQALEGKPLNGALPDEYYREVIQLGDSGRKGCVGYRYVVERLHCQLRVLEPSHAINPYRRILKSDELEKELALLTDLTDKKEVIAQVERLWNKPRKSARGESARALIAREALNLAPRVSEEFACTMLHRAMEALDASPFPPAGPFEFTGQVQLLTRALFVAAHFDRTDIIPALVTRFKKTLLPDMEPEPLLAVARAANHCFRGLRKMGMRDEIQELLALMSQVMLGGRNVVNTDVQEMAGKPHQLVALLEVAGGWLSFGQTDRAEHVLKVSQEVLFQNEVPQASHVALAKAYIAALGQGSVESSKDRLQELLQNLRGIRDNFGPNAYHISQSQLEVIETIILAVTHDDFALGPTARRWLEDDEFLVRQRIHREVRALIGPK